MITRLNIKNFKSLEDFWFPSEEGTSLAPLTVLVGLNGSGKSTLLQALDFLGHLVSGSVTHWLESRDWKAADLLTSLPTIHMKTISFSLTWKDEDHGEIFWMARYNTITKRCTNELVALNNIDSLILTANAKGLFALNENLQPEFEHDQIPFEYEGSILSALKLDKLHPALKCLKLAMEQLKSLELMSPHLMRKRAKAANDIGLGGEKLSAFLSSFDKDAIKGLNSRLQKFYPKIDSLKIKSLQAGWKELRVKEKQDGISEFGATHLNDGLLRVIGILSQVFTTHSVVLFDEIENGVNQQIVAQLMDFLMELSKKRQVIITTHSPLIINFLPDEVARESVMFLYKNKRGATKARRFFDLPRVAWKIEGLGPGEAFVDTDLTALSAELANEEGGEA